MNSLKKLKYFVKHELEFVSGGKVNFIPISYQESELIAEQWCYKVCRCK